MIIQCQSCSRKFVVEDSNIPSKGRTVQCGYCSVVWHQMPLNKKNNKVSRTSEIKPTETSKPSTVNNIKASDGKTYKLLGNVSRRLWDAQDHTFPSALGCVGNVWLSSEKLWDGLHLYHFMERSIRK